MTGTRLVLEGTHAVSWGVQRSRVGVVAAYPITPSSSAVELLAEMCADGRLDGRFVAVESEHSALATCAGASLAGVRAFTATSSHGLAYMHEVLHWCSGARLPVVLANVNRSLGAPWNILVDQTDSLSQRDTGWIQFYCETGQEVLDTIIQAFYVAEKVRLPVMVCLDAFFLSHTSEPVIVPAQDDVDAWLPPCDPELRLDVSRPRAFGGLTGPDLYLELRGDIARSMDAALVVAEEAAQSWARTFGRMYPLVEVSSPEPADLALVTTGTVAGTAREVIEARRARGDRIRLVRLRLFRPLPVHALRAALDGAARVAVFDRNVSFGHGGIVASELRAALYGQANRPAVLSYVGGLGGRDLTPEVLDDVIAHALDHDGSADETMWVDAS